MLRAALARWGGRAGVDVLFLTDRRYRLEAAEGEAALVVTHRLSDRTGEEKAR